MKITIEVLQLMRHLLRRQAPENKRIRVIDFGPVNYLINCRYQQRLRK
jgi:hypothetical protein